MTKATVWIAIAVVALAGCSGTWGSKKACGMYRYHAGEVETGAMTASAYAAQAADIREAADRGTDASIKGAADYLMYVSDGVRTGSVSLGDLEDAERKMLRACSAAGY